MLATWDHSDQQDLHSDIAIYLLFFSVFEIGPYVAWANLEFAMYLRIALNF